MGADTFAVFPNLYAVDGYNCFIVVAIIKGSINVLWIFLFSAKPKQTGTGHIICGNTVNRVFSGNVDRKTTNITVVDIQHSLLAGISVLDRAVVKVNCNIRCIAFVIDVYDLAGRIKGTVVKGHDSRTI